MHPGGTLALAEETHALASMRTYHRQEHRPRRLHWPFWLVR